MSEVKNHFKVPEGRYVLHSAKTVGLVPFAMRRTTRLTIATLHGGEEEGMYMVYNVGDYLHIAPFDATEKVRRQLRLANPPIASATAQHTTSWACTTCLPCPRATCNTVMRKCSSRRVVPATGGVLGS